MKLVKLLILLSPFNSFAQQSLPNPKPDQSICYVRTYSKAHLEQHPKQKIKGAALAIARGPKDYPYVSSALFVATKKGKIYGAGGNAWDGRSDQESGESVNFPATRIETSIDCDGGAFEVIQSSKDKDQVTVRLLRQVRLEGGDADCGDNPMYIEKGSEDSTMVLKRAPVRSEYCGDALRKALKK